MRVLTCTEVSATKQYTLMIKSSSARVLCKGGFRWKSHDSNGKLGYSMGVKSRESRYIRKIYFAK